jgi:hypothetical protein
MYTTLTAHWEDTKDSISEISSSRIMSEIRTRHQEESTNLMLQPILYNDIRYNTERLKAIFGMESTLDVVLNILPLVDKPLVSICIF